MSKENFFFLKDIALETLPMKSASSPRKEGRLFFLDSNKTSLKGATNTNLTKHKRVKVGRRYKSVIPPLAPYIITPTQRDKL